MTTREFTGFVLAGGQSRRMGRDKAQIPWGSGTLLTHAVGVLQEIASEVLVVGTVKSVDAAVVAIADVFPEHGPMAGIHAALEHSNTEWNLILAVDLPLVPPELLGFIAGRCPNASGLAVVPKVSGRLQPLCAAYHRGLLMEIERAIGNDDLSIHRLLERLSTGIMETSGDIWIIEDEELITQGFDTEVLINVNTAEDLERARGIAKRMHGN